MIVPGLGVGVVCDGQIMVSLVGRNGGECARYLKVKGVVCRPNTLHTAMRPRKKT